MADLPIPREKHCFNCKSTDITRPVFCDDCWRMAVIMNAAGGIFWEMFHRVIELVAGG